MVIRICGKVNKHVVQKVLEMLQLVALKILSCRKNGRLITQCITQVPESNRKRYDQHENNIQKNFNHTCTSTSLLFKATLTGK